MKRPLILLTLSFVLSAAVLAPAQTPPSANTPADAAINALREGLIDSFVKGDIDRLLTFLSPDVIVTWQNAEVCRGPNEVRAYYDRMMKGDRPIVKKITAQPEVLGRQSHGDWAVSWGKLNDHFALTDGRDLALNSVFTVTTAKQGDRWLVTGYHASVNAFDNPILKLAIRKVAIWTTAGGLAVGFLLAWVLRRARK